MVVQNIRYKNKRINEHANVTDTQLSPSISSCRFSNSTASLTIRTRFLGMFERFAVGSVFRLTGPTHSNASIWSIKVAHGVSATAVSSQ